MESLKKSILNIIKLNKIIFFLSTLLFLLFWYFSNFYFSFFAIIFFIILSIQIKDWIKKCGGVVNFFLFYDIIFKYAFKFKAADKYNFAIEIEKAKNKLKIRKEDRIFQTELDIKQKLDTEKSKINNKINHLNQKIVTELSEIEKNLPKEIFTFKYEYSKTQIIYKRNNNENIVIDIGVYHHSIIKKRFYVKFAKVYLGKNDEIQKSKDIDFNNHVLFKDYYFYNNAIKHISFEIGKIVGKTKLNI